MVFTGCSSQDKKPKPADTFPRPATLSEASVFSRIFTNNLSVKSAAFVARYGKIPDGFIAKGNVDWVNEKISTDVNLDSADVVGLSSVQTADGLFETFPGLAAAETDANLAQRTWVYRSIDTTKYGIDVLSSFILHLTATAPGNPLLLKQDGLKNMGTDKVDGEDTTVFDRKTVRYWINNDGTIRKIQTTLQDFSGPVTVTFSNFSNSTVEVPAVSDSYPYEKVSSFYSSVRPGF